MSKTLQFDDRVAVVTGAGNGLGRSHALGLAKRGAKVVVNDLGGSTTGDGSDQSVAQRVVDEIHALGGEAVASTDSVEFGEKIIETAVNAFGRVDILVNNAGILRDASFHKMTPGDWALVQKIHLEGSFSVTRAAWPWMRKAGYGRIVMTASAAGIYGNFGQANYAAAKLGLVGLAQTLAIEGASKDIVVNTVAPVAASRMTETVMPPQMLDALKPELVTPLVVKLCHESNDVSGQLFEVGGGWIAMNRWQQSQGATFDPKTPLTAEDVVESWHEIESFAKPSNPSKVADSLAVVGRNIGVDLGLAPQ